MEKEEEHKIQEEPV